MKINFFLSFFILVIGIEVSSQGLPWKEGFEGADNGYSYIKDTNNLKGLANASFDQTAFGRLRFLGTPLFNHSGKYAATFDTYSGTSSQKYLIFNVDLSNYSQSKSLTLSFWGISHDDNFDNNKDIVQVRGDTGKTWIKAGDLKFIHGEWGLREIDIDTLLRKNNQVATSRFQVRFGHYDLYSTLWVLGGDGISIDDIEIRLDTNSDIGVSSIRPFCKGNSPVKVKLENFSTKDTLYKTNINWKVNGVSQTAYTWQDTLLPGKSRLVTLGSYNFGSSTYTIEAYTDSINSLNDLQHSNDTVRYTSKTRLGGVYKIGGTNPDFVNFDSAITALEQRGVCDSVTFYVRSGVYNGQFVLSEYQGMSALNKVRFTADTSNTSPVIIEDTSTLASYVVKFESSRYFEFSHFTIHSVQQSTPVLFSGLNSNISFTHNIIKPKTGLPTNSPLWVILLSGVSTNIEISNNKIVGGSDGIHIVPTRVTGDRGKYIITHDSLLVNGNQILDWKATGLYIQKVRHSVFKNNEIVSRKVTAGGFPTKAVDADLSSYCDFSGNKCIAYNILHSIGIKWMASKHINIVNNMVSLPNKVNENYSFGILLNGTNDSKVFHNSVYVNNDYLTYEAGACYIYNCSRVRVSNNSLANFGKGLAFSKKLNSNLNSGNNNLYSSGSWYPGNFNPYYVNPIDLHASNKNLLNRASPVLFLIGHANIDFDGESRNIVKPTIGADEFSVKANDAGIIQVNSLCEGLSPVQINLINFGTDTVKKMSIHWFVNGVKQGVKKWTGKLGQLKQSEVILGTYNFNSTSTTYTVKAFIDSVNDKQDQVSANDTILYEQLPSLNGMYTIGGTAPDFSSVNNATAKLIENGVCGPVTFYIRQGTYNEQIKMDFVKGVDSVNTIRFTKDTTNTQPVVISYKSTSKDTNYTWAIYSSKYITIDNLNIEATGKTYSHVFQFLGTNNEITIRDCNIKGNVYPQYSKHELAVIYNSNPTGNTSSNVSILKNDISGGSYGVLFLRSNNINISENVISNWRSKAIDIGSTEGVSIVKNKIHNNDTLRWSYGSTGIAILSSLTYKISKNELIIKEGGYGIIGISVGNSHGKKGNHSLISNNMISLVDTGINYTATGIHVDGGNFLDIVNNSIRTHQDRIGKGVPAYLIRFTDSSSFRNNILANFGKGRALFWWNGNKAQRSNNNFFTNGTQLGTVIYPNSLSVDPMFVSLRNLHTKCIDLNEKGKALNIVKTDFDDEPRNSSFPDIGADEFNLPKIDASLKSILSPVDSICGDSNLTIKIVVRNVGQDTLKSIPVTIEVSGNVNQVVRDTLLSNLVKGEYDTLSIVGINASIGGSISLVAYTSVVLDSVALNDTIKLDSIYIKPIPVWSVPSLLTVCYNSDTTVVTTGSNNSVYWYKSQATTLINLIDSGKTLSLSNVIKTDTVWVRAKNNLGCYANSRRVIINTKPSLSVNLGKDTAFCKGSSFSLLIDATTTGATSYKWQNSSTGIKLSATLTGIYFVDVSASNGCISRDSLIITELPLPKVSQTSIAPFCENLGQYRLTGGTPSGGIYKGQYVTNPYFDAASSGGGTFFVHYSYTNTNSCTDSVRVKVEVYPKPNASLVLSPDTFCITSLNKLTSGLPTNGFYFGNAVNTGKSEYSPTKIGIDSIYYVYQDVKSCIDTTMALATVINRPTVSIDSVLPVCSNAATIQLVGKPSGGIFSGIGIVGSTFDPKIGAGNHTINYLYKSKYCSETSQTNILIHKVDTVKHSTFPEYCDNIDSINLTGGTPIGGQYSGVHVNTANSTFDVKTSGSGTFSVKYQYVNAQGCQDSLSTSIDIVSLPQKVLSDTIRICGSTTTAKLDAQNAGAKYLWNTNDTTSSIVVSSQGKYSVQITNGVACSLSDSTYVKYNAICLGINKNIFKTEQVVLFPIPSRGMLNVNLSGFENGEVKISILSISGSEVYSQKIDLSTANYIHNLDLQELSSGTYVFMLKTKKGVISQRFLIQK